MSDNNNDKDYGSLGVVVAAYTDENAAAETLSRLKDARSEGNLDYDDAVVVHQTADGDVKFSETGDMSPAAGAGIGALFGAALALLGGPAGLLVSTGVSAAAGGLMALHDSGFSNDSIKELGSALEPGTSAILVTTDKHFTEEVRNASKESDRRSTLESLSSSISQALKGGSNIMFGLFLDENNVVATQIQASDDVVSVFGAAADEDSMAAGQMVVDSQGNAAYAEVGAATDSSDSSDSSDDSDGGAKSSDDNSSDDDGKSED